MNRKTRYTPPTKKQDDDGRIIQLRAYQRKPSLESILPAPDSKPAQTIAMPKPDLFAKNVADLDISTAIAMGVHEASWLARASGSELEFGKLNSRAARLEKKIGELQSSIGFAMPNDQNVYLIWASLMHGDCEQACETLAKAIKEKGIYPSEARTNAFLLHLIYFSAIKGNVGSSEKIDALYPGFVQSYDDVEKCIPIGVLPWIKTDIILNSFMYQVRFASKPDEAAPLIVASYRKTGKIPRSD